MPDHRTKPVVYWKHGLPYVRVPDPTLLSAQTALAALRAHVWARDERRKSQRRRAR